MQFPVLIRYFAITNSTIICYYISDVLYETNCTQLLRLPILFHPDAAPHSPTAGNMPAVISRGDTDVKLE